MNLPLIALNALRALSEAASRTRDSCFTSGLVCARTYFSNAWVKYKNRHPSSRVNCPCCGWEGYAFLSLDVGTCMFPQIACPHCNSHDRHRMMHVFLSRTPPVFMEKSGRVLHFAPEPQIGRFLRERPHLKVISTDAFLGGLQGAPTASFLQDIHDLPIQDNSFDGLFNVHVLEHVRDDRRAIQEFLRVLKPGGAAVIMVPFDPTRTTTDEWGKPNPEIFDHVRNYSEHDFEQRLAGFEYQKIAPPDILSEEEINRYKIRSSEIIFVCRKPVD